MKIISDPKILRQHIQKAHLDQQTVGLVPTMGALHAGHLSLAETSSKGCDFTVATIFVNPTQFAPGEDLDKYPRTLQQDCEKLQAAQVDVLFTPSADVMYPPGFSTAVNPPEIAVSLEGEFRPSHFQGVCTIVLKLLNLVGPDRAFFGQKDYQQVAVVQKMVIDLNVPVEIVVCPTVREADGLAMSSRNVYLSDRQREIALSIHATLEFVKQQIRAGQRDAYELMAEMRQRLIDAGVDSIDYTAIADAKSLKVPDTIEGEVVALIAAYVGETRLIDNCLIGTAGPNHD